MGRSDDYGGSEHVGKVHDHSRQRTDNPEHVGRTRIAVSRCHDVHPIPPGHRVAPIDGASRVCQEAPKDGNDDQRHVMDGLICR